MAKLSPNFMRTRYSDPRSSVNPKQHKSKQTNKKKKTKKTKSKKYQIKFLITSDFKKILKAVKREKRHII